MVNHGKCCWYEFYSDDVEKSKSFYSELFNWSVGEMDMPQGKYAMFKAGDSEVAGLVPSTDVLQNTWLAYVVVPSLDETVASLTKQGGQVLVEKVEAPGVGSWVVAKDPQGALFAPFEPADRNVPDSTEMPAQGQFCWHELMCTDREKAFDFYSSLFNWQKAEAMEMGPMGVYQIYSRNNQPMGGLMNITPEMNIPTPFWIDYVHVADVDQTIARASELGGQAGFPAMDLPDGGRIAGLVDNCGAVIAVWKGGE